MYLFVFSRINRELGLKRATPKVCVFSFWDKLRFRGELQKSQFLLDTLVPPLPLEFSNFSKNCDFSNFSQFLLLRANLDMSLICKHAF